MSTHEKELANGLKAAVVAVVLEDGTCPATAYMHSVKCEAKFQARFQTLAQVGTLRVPEFMRHLSDGVFEIKVEDGPGRRVFGQWKGRAFVVTHGVDKPKPKAIAKEIDRTHRLFAYWNEKEGLS